MVSNPIQKQKRNSMLIGLFVGLVIGLILCVVLYMFLQSNIKAGVASGDEAITVAVLNKNIKSGTEITAADYIMKKVNKANAPTDAVNPGSASVVAKIDLTAGTIVSNSMLSQKTEQLTKDLREQEYNMITLPTNLTTGNFIDIRLQLPDGGDYIVVSKKCVQKTNATTVWLKLNEEEILSMSNAIIEYYIMAGSKLYATIYTDPGAQEAATPTYSPNETVKALMLNNDNITTQLQDETGRFVKKLKDIRNTIINRELGKYSETGLENLEKNIQDEIKNLQESRQSYFGALNSAK